MSSWCQTLGRSAQWFSPLTPQGGSLSLCNSPSSSVYPPRGVGPDLITSLPSYPITCKTFLQTWLYKSLSASLQFVFSENCSTCRCIFDVSWGEVSSTSSYSTILIYLLYKLLYLLSNCPPLGIDNIWKCLIPPGITTDHAKKLLYFCKFDKIVSHSSFTIMRVDTF